MVVGGAEVADSSWEDGGGLVSGFEVGAEELEVVGGQDVGGGGVLLSEELYWT